MSKTKADFRYVLTPTHRIVRKRVYGERGEGRYKLLYTDADAATKRDWTNRRNSIRASDAFKTPEAAIRALNKRLNKSVQRYEDLANGARVVRDTALAAAIKKFPNPKFNFGRRDGSQIPFA